MAEFKKALIREAISEMVLDAHANRPFKWDRVNQAIEDFEDEVQQDTEALVRLKCAKEFAACWPDGKEIV